MLIAVLLVAAGTAGVLFDVIGGLENDAAATGDESGEEVLSGLSVVGTTGYVNASNGTVERISVVLKLSETATATDLSATVVTTTLNSSTTVSVGSTPGITVESLRDDDGSLDTNVLNHPDDRAALHIDTASVVGSPLQPRASGILRLTTESGSTTTVEVTVPSSLSNESTVSL